MYLCWRSFHNHGFLWHFCLFQLLVFDLVIISLHGLWYLCRENLLDLLLLSLSWLRHSRNALWVLFQQWIGFLVRAQDDASSARNVYFEVIWSLINLVWVSFEPNLMCSVKSFVTTIALLIRFEKDEVIR